MKIAYTKARFVYYYYYTHSYDSMCFFPGHTVLMFCN